LFSTEKGLPREALGKVNEAIHGGAIEWIEFIDDDIEHLASRQDRSGQMEKGGGWGVLLQRCRRMLLETTIHRVTTKYH
jgi:hypothetical protein